MAKSYTPANICIYCGSERYDALQPSRKLGDEHIIPYSLAGNIILPEASCKNCEDVTKNIEGKITRGMFLPARTQLQYPSRRKKQRPTHLPLDIETNDGLQKKQIAIPDYPGMLVVFHFGVPEILWGGVPHENFSGGVGIATLPGFGENLNKHPRRKVTWNLGGDAVTYGRLLAKIAHAYAVAELGMNGFKPFLNNIILGKSPLHLAQFVGSELGVPPPTTTINEISLQERTDIKGRKFIAVEIRLFANREGMPIYLVIAGEPK